MRQIVTVVLACVAAVLAMGAGALALAQDEPPPSAASAVPIPPGQIDAAIGQLDGLAAQMMQQTGVPGMAIAVVHDDRVVYAKGFGVRRLGDPAPIDADTVFQLASVSKTVGASVVAGAAGRRVVGWDDPVIRHLPGFRLKRLDTTRNVTIADLYSHRSGLPDHAGDDLEPLGYSRAQILRRLRYEPLAPLRAEYAYTNYGLTAAALAVARAAGTPWAKLSEQTLYRPLGMRSTSSRFADYEHARDRAWPHVLRDGRWVPIERPFNPDRESPAGGVTSSVADLAQWMRMMLADGVYDGRRIVGADALAAMRTPHSVSAPAAIPAGRPGLYGLGIGTGTDPTGRVFFSHSGAFEEGAATQVSLLPSEHLGIVVLTNGEPMGLPESLVQTFLDLVELGHPSRDWLGLYGPAFAAAKQSSSPLAGRPRPAHPRAARSDPAYLGAWSSAYLGHARVVRRGGHLELVAGPARKTYPLRHWSGDTFTTGTGRLFGAVTFAGRDARGRATSVTVDSLNTGGLGTYRRAG
jgi:CubicO group peptidase (beta-lactamase class C family)